MACNTNQNKNFKGITLAVDLAKQEVSLKELFSRMEVIPLETHDSCLIINAEKILFHKNKLYVFDPLRAALYVFDEEGNFIKQISRKGEGPGEYQIITDVLIDSSKENILFLSPYGNILTYDTEGNFIDQKTLPAKPNYYSLTMVAERNTALWSCVDEEENGLSIVNAETMKPVYETWHNDRMIDMGLMKPFYQYDSDSYFSTAYQNVVYRIKPDSLESAYQWDFGKDNISRDKLTAYSKITNDSERNNQILKDLEEGILPYSMERNNQNNNYYYVALRKGTGLHRPWINVFYRKGDGKSFVFGKTQEGICIYPLIITNEYLLSILSFEDIPSYKNVLSQEEYDKLTGRDQEDNLCLIKLYFK